MYTGVFTSDNEPHRIKNATYNTCSKKAGYFNFSSQLFSKNVVWVGFFILSGPLLLVNNPVLLHEQVKKVLVSKYLKITYFFMEII
jgi:hypothetical protein